MAGAGPIQELGPIARGFRGIRETEQFSRITHLGWTAEASRDTATAFRDMAKAVPETPPGTWDPTNPTVGLHELLKARAEGFDEIAKVAENELKADKGTLTLEEFRGWVQEQTGLGRKDAGVAVELLAEKLGAIPAAAA